MRIPRPRTLFGKTLATIALVAVGFQLFTIAVIAYQMLIPLGKRSADDLAVLMIDAAQSWHATPPGRREAAAAELERRTELAMRTPALPLQPSDSWLPYRFFVESSLERRLGSPVRMLGSRVAGEGAWFWADIPVEGEAIRVGFPRSRIDVGPLIALLMVLSVGTWVSLMTAIALARRISAPLERLSGAAAAVGRGQWPEPLPVTGPREVSVLTESFNRMTSQVRELVANRTTLLSGISHDLRTPLTQIRLAIEMLSSQESDAGLLAGIRRDLDNMNRMIGQFLEIGRELEAGEGESVELTVLLNEVIGQFVAQRVRFLCGSCTACGRVTHGLALRRVMNNLLENALRYGGDEPVELSCRREGAQIRIMIADRGPGIPESERDAVFRPFHRLEDSRSGETGGSGLGLAVVKQLADGHGWRVEILDREGGGTRVCLTLPAAE